MTPATPDARKRQRTTTTASARPEQERLEAAPGHALAVTEPYLDRLCRSRPYAVTSRIGSITRTDHYSGPQAAARGAAQARRDLALLAARLDSCRCAARTFCRDSTTPPPTTNSRASRLSHSAPGSCGSARSAPGKTEANVARSAGAPGTRPPRVAATLEDLGVRSVRSACRMVVDLGNRRDAA
jgi:hypothetical protein